MTFLDEIKKLTTDPGARRLAQVVDELKAQIDACCEGNGSQKPELADAAQVKPAPGGSGKSIRPVRNRR